MTFWTLMFITVIGGEMDGSQSYVLHRSMADCNAAISATSDTITYDHAMECVASDTPSGSIRPRQKPKGE